jgi:hypothetical protein
MHGLGQTSETYIAPSWSWAALKFRAETDLHAIYYLEAEIDESKFRAEILGCEVVTLDDGPYGSVSSGRLRLRSLWLGLKQWESGKDVQIGSPVTETYLGVEQDLNSGLGSEFENSDAEHHDSEHSDSDKDYLDLEEEKDLDGHSDFGNAGLDSLQVLDLDLEIWNLTSKPCNGPCNNANQSTQIKTNKDYNNSTTSVPRRRIRGWSTKRCKIHP